MTENRNHGFRIRFYFGLILIIAACVIGFFNFQKQIFVEIDPHHDNF